MISTPSAAFAQDTCCILEEIDVASQTVAFVERGEFHTFAFAGPMFRKPLAVRAGEVVIRDGFVFADVLPEAAAASAAAL